MSSDPIDPVPFEPDPFNQPQQKVPPQTVVYAVWSQYAILAIAVITTILTIVSTMDLVEQMRDALSSTNVLSQAELDTLLSLTQMLAIGISIVTLLFAVAIGILGYFNSKGRNGARIATWVLAGIGLACGVCSGMAAPFGTAADTSVSGGDDMTRAVNDALARIEVPAWQNTVSIVLLIISTLLYLAVIVLLAMPKSNDFFRKEPHGGQPPSHFG